MLFSGLDPSVIPTVFAACSVSENLFCGVSTIVLEEKTAPSRFPSANATQARTMEHYRRLGFAEKVRARGLPPDYPTDIAYFSRYTKYELARFSLPSARQAREIVKTLTGLWSAAELPHRVSQIFVEDVL